MINLEAHYKCYDCKLEPLCDNEDDCPYNEEDLYDDPEYTNVSNLDK